MPSWFRTAQSQSWMVVLCIVWSVRVAIAEPIAPANERFREPSTEAVPTFQAHVVPLLGKLGCNGRACHGSFQGQGGLRLSLFGYDFKMDHDGLLSRIDLTNPVDSYALKKATLTEEHRGGRRMEIGSWEYNLLLKWIQSGAKPADELKTLSRLEVTPHEILFSEHGQTTPLKVVAMWDDGSQEDVTCLCRFQTNDPQVCEISHAGLVTSNEPGDTHVIVFYDNGVAPIPVLRPVSPQFGDKYPPVATRTRIDEFVVDKLKRLGTLPSELCSDTEFLRRVSLDLTGTLPTADEVRAFSQDTASDKRARKVDALLESPAYAAWWTTRLCDWTGNAASQLNNVTGGRELADREWYDWIYRRVADNVPYDKLCEGIVLATSRKDGESYEQLCQRMSETYKTGKSSENGDGLVYYWARQNFTKAEDRAVGFAYTFLASRIQCAQCHKHPFDQWTQSDFEQFQAFFTRVVYARNGSDKKVYNDLVSKLGVDPKKLNGNKLREALAKAAQEGKLIPVADLHVQPPKNNPKNNRPKKDNGKRNLVPDSPKAKLLGGDVVEINKMSDPRTALMEWLRTDPLFAKAFVNRVWGNYFHRGIVEPTDDMNLANPPSNEPLLNYLAEGFVSHHYDMKWVHREICNSDTYQRSWKPTLTNAGDERNFSRAVPRRIPAETTVDAIHLATARTADVDSFDTDVQSRALWQASTPRRLKEKDSTNMVYSLGVFGRSTRDNACDCDRSSEATLLQTLYLRNDTDIFREIDRGDGWMAELGQKYGVPHQQPNLPAVKYRPVDYESQLAKLQSRAVKLKDSSDKRKAKNAARELANYQKRYGKLLPSPPGQKAQAPASKSDSEIILPQAEARKILEEAYLRTVSRFPSESELATAIDYIRQADTPLSGVRDVVWSLLNTKEFIVNH